MSDAMNTRDVVISAVSVRVMNRSDLSRVRELSVQLGYAASFEETAARFDRIAARSDQVMFVAIHEERAVGWIHVHPQLFLESEPYAEMAGLVVDHETRRMGAGRKLVVHAQQWARQRGFKRLRVRSNVNREESHQFYSALGFRFLKTQHNYELDL